MSFLNSQELEMTNINLSKAQASLKLALWNAEAEFFKSSELYRKLQELGLPTEIVDRLHELINFTKNVTGKVLSVGKIVLLKIIEFVKSHPFLVAGMGVGAVIGTAIAGLITSIPFLGQILAPIALLIQTTFTTIGAVVRHKLDKQLKDIGKDIAEIVQQFFLLVSQVFNAILCNAATI